MTIPWIVDQEVLKETSSCTLQPRQARDPTITSSPLVLSETSVQSWLLSLMEKEKRTASKKTMVHSVATRSSKKEKSVTAVMTTRSAQSPVVIQGR